MPFSKSPIQALPPDFSAGTTGALILRHRRLLSDRARSTRNYHLANSPSRLPNRRSSWTASTTPLVTPINTPNEQRYLYRNFRLGHLLLNLGRL